VVHQCSLEVRDREFVAVVGESGGGKTTILRLCCGLLQAELAEDIRLGHQIRGRVTFDGAEVEAPRRNFSYVPQHFREGLHPAKSTKENILLAVQESGVSAEEEAHADRLMQRCGISEAADMNVLRLSGGQQQRVAICRALIKRPAILFMDEPFANLDPTLRPGIGDLLQALRDEHGLSLLFVTHDIEGAVRLANRVVGVKNSYGPPQYRSWNPAECNPIVLRKAIEDWIAL